LGEKSQLSDKLQECENENFTEHLGKKLEDVLTLKELMPQILHYLVEKITRNTDGTIHIQYSFVIPLQET
jgi:site-specific DNA recombinase